MLTLIFKSVSVKEFNYQEISKKIKVHGFEIMVSNTCNIVILYLLYPGHINLSDLNWSDMHGDLEVDRLAIISRIGLSQYLSTL